MSTPQKRSRRVVTSSTARISEPSLPLHLALAHILVRVYPIGADRAPLALYSTTFTASVLELVAREIYELSDVPATFTVMRDEVQKLLVPQTKAIGRYNGKLRNRGHAISEELAEAEHQQNWMDTYRESFETVPDGCAFLDNLEKEVRDRINEDDEQDLTEVPEPIERRSPIGLFLRGLLLALRKLSFDETAHLSAQIGEWCGVQPAGPSSTHLWSLNRKLAMEDTLDKRMSANQGFTSASDSADYSGALSSLRRFYDYQFPSSARGRHQHALLNLASFHYSTGGLASAREAVDEAIRVARAEGDHSCLRHCMSLSHRLDAEINSAALGPAETWNVEQRFFSDSSLPRATSPMDELWSLKSALDLGEPVHIALRRVHLALSRYEAAQVKSDSKRDSQSGWTTDPPFDEGAWHAAQAGLWSMLGSESLCEVHEDLALATADVLGDTRLTVLLARAERMVNKGKYDQALGSLTEFAVLDHMSIESYRQWTRMLWTILRRQAALQDHHEAMDILQALDGSGISSHRLGPGGPVRGLEVEKINPQGGVLLVHEEIRSSLSKARKLLDANSPPHLIFPHILSAIQLCAQLGLWPMYRAGVVLLSETLLSIEEAGMSQRALKGVKSIWAELENSGDEELIGRAQLVMARAAIADNLENGTEEYGLAMSHLEAALTSAERIQSRKLITHCTTLLDLIRSHNRDARQKRDPRLGSGDDTRRMGEIVKLVGVRVAERWS